MNSVPAQPGGRRMLPWILVALLVMGLGFALYKQMDTAVSVDHLSQQVALVSAQRDTLKVLIDSQVSSYTKDGVIKALTRYPQKISFSEGEDLLIVGPMGLRFEGERLKSVDLE